MAISKDSLDTKFHGISYISEAINKMNDELYHKRDAALKALLRVRLQQLGHTFDNDESFIEFAKGRLTKVSYASNPYDQELYLDYNSATDRGTLLVTFSTKVTMTDTGGKITLTIG